MQNGRLLLKVGLQEHIGRSMLKKLQHWLVWTDVLLGYKQQSCCNLAAIWLQLTEVSKDGILFCPIPSGGLICPSWAMYKLACCNVC
jgi:hypothetical protein